MSNTVEVTLPDIGDFEQNASDLLQGGDYPLLVALRAPRPTLLIYNAEDDCCFRGSLCIHRDLPTPGSPEIRIRPAI